MDLIESESRVHGERNRCFVYSRLKYTIAVLITRRSMLFLLPISTRTRNHPFLMNGLAVQLHITLSISSLDRIASFS